MFKKDTGQIRKMSPAIVFQDGTQRIDAGVEGSNKLLSSAKRVAVQSVRQIIALNSL